LTNWDSKKNRFDEFYLAQHCCSDAQPAKEVVCVLSNGVISRDLQDSKCTMYMQSATDVVVSYSETIGFGLMIMFKCGKGMLLIVAVV